MKFLQKISWATNFSPFPAIIGQVTNILAFPSKHLSCNKLFHFSFKIGRVTIIFAFPSNNCMVMGQIFLLLPLL